MCLAPTFASAADVTLAWDSNQENDVAGYRLHYGTSSGNYTQNIDVGNITEHTLTGLQDGTTYYFAVTAYDLDNYESGYSQELSYTAGNQNSSPTTPAVPNSPSSGYVGTSYSFSTSASDPDGDAIEYQFDWGDGAASSWGAATRSHSWSSAGTYCVKAHARDSQGAISDWSGCRNISIATPTYTISASAGSNGSISPAGTVTVNQGAGRSFTINANQSYQVLDVRVDGASVGAVTSYTFTNVTQNHTISASFVSVNQAPTANAGPDQTVTEGAAVTLNGSNSKDPGGSIASYQWRQIDGLTVQLSQAGTQRASFAAPNVGMAGETLTFRLTVTDNGGLQGVDTCVVTVTKAAVVDSDGDGVPDAQDAFPYDPDEYLDTDGDGVGNNADLDDDNDGLPDEWELAYGLNPLRNDAAEDPDGDGVNNINEFNLGTAPNHYEGNFSPNPPILLAPENGAVVGLTPRLETDQFDDPNVNDVHGKTQWQIIRASDDVPVLDVTSSNSLTSIEIPNLILEEDTEYVWQVKFLDNHDSASDWSVAGHFTTDFNNQDSNGNGIPDDQELDTTLDLDQDGIPDSEQDDIKSVVVEGGSTQIGISIRDEDRVQSIEAFESENLADLQPHAKSIDQPANLPYGLISFKLIVDQPGDEVEVALHLSGEAPADSTWFKYDPVDAVWSDYSAYTEFSVDRKTVYLTLVDGGFGDADGIANGIIVDPLGLGATSSPAPAEGASGGGGGGAGCFISASSNSIEITSPAAIRQKLAELAFMLTLLLVIFILARCLKMLNSYKVR